jgi:hypothetical protein
MKRISLALAGCALAVAISSTGAAAAAKYQTDVTVLGGGPSPTGGFIAFGVLESEHAKCVGGRKLSYLIPPPSKRRGGAEMIDSDRSSTNGAWAFEEQGSPTGQEHIVVQKKVLKDGSVCKGTDYALTR